MFYNTKENGLAQRLIIYLLATLVLTFFLIFFIVITNSRKFINKNASELAHIMAINTINTLNRRVVEIERIPQAIASLYGDITPENAHLLPARLLVGYSQFVSCSVAYDSTQCGLNHPMYYSAYRVNKDSIASFCNKRDLFYSLNPKHALRINSQNGFWIKIGSAPNIIVSYCAFLKEPGKRPFAILKIDFSMQELTNFINDFHFFRNGYLLIIDKHGNFIAHPDANALNTSNISTYQKSKKILAENVYEPFMQGKSGFGIFSKNGINHFIYYTPIPNIDWRIGVVCPHSEILFSSSSFIFLLLLTLSIGLSFLFWASFKIAYTVSHPLKEFSSSVRKAAEGNFDVPLPENSSTKEIHELHRAFQYMQQNLMAYVGELKTNAAANERINAEMKLAKKLQRRFLPRLTNCPDSIELFSELRQSYEVGGDLYDYFIMDQKLFFVVGDVSGKGTPAALYMASIMKLFRNVSSQSHSTAEICSIINTYMCQNNGPDDDMYITMFVGILDILTGKMTFTNAGHPYPFVIQSKSEVLPLDNYPDAPIGIVDEHPFNEYVYDLKPNSLILLYTDGVTDAEDAGARFYGGKRFEVCVRQAAGSGPQFMINAIMDNIKEFIGDAPQTDDLTLLSILYKGNLE